MAELYQIAVLRFGVALLAILAIGLALAGLWQIGLCLRRQLKTLSLAAMSFMAIVASVLAQKGDRGAGTTGVPPAEVEQSREAALPPLRDELANVLHLLERQGGH